MQNPFFIVGQTAAGKTEAALALAEQCAAEIVGADAAQVYAGLDLLTAKPSPRDRARVAHHLVGTVPLADAYNVARYRADALHCLDSIQARGRRALVTGGSGLYVKALTHGLSPLPSADPVLRAELELLDAAALLARLEALDPVTASTIDAKNKRRLVRAVEVCLSTGQAFSRQRDHWSSDADAPATRGVFLFRDPADMHARIEARVETIFAAGVLDEVRAVPENAPGPTAARIIGLSDIRLHLDGKLTLGACKDRLKAATRQYAKRQMTWFKRELIFEPVNLSRKEGQARIATIVGASQNKVEAALRAVPFVSG
jgi:tRNA dimethylallyltransferase